MRRQDLESTILDYILTTYSANYTGFFEINQDGTTYVLEIGIPSYMTKTTMSGQFDTDEEFLDYIKNEFNKRNYMRVYFYKTIREEDGRNE